MSRAEEAIADEEKKKKNGHMPKGWTAAARAWFSSRSSCP